MRAVVAGSRRMPAGAATLAVAAILAHMPTDAQVVVRASAAGVLGPFEADVAMICGLIRQTWVKAFPKPAETPGRASVYRRDIEMVSGADLVLIFLAEEDLEDGYSGTYHLWEQALAQDRPVYGWVVRGGNVERWGESDPEHRFSDLIDGIRA